MPDKISREEMAANYGWALSFLKSNKELWKLFNKAVDQSWSVNRFVASLRNTKWFRQHSETYRKTQVLQKTDPKTYSQRLAQTRAKLGDMASQLGADIGGKRLDQMAKNAMWFEWSDNQVRNALANFIDQMGDSGHYGGEAGEAENELRQYAADMGVRLGDTTLKKYLVQIVSGAQTIEDYKGYLQSVAENNYSLWADKIKSGTTVRQLAEPYVQQMAQTLEMNPGEIDLFTPEIKKALQYQGPDGKPATKTTWQFDEDLRKDPRWLKTNNARTSILSAGNQLLKDFGIQF